MSPRDRIQAAARRRVSLTPMTPRQQLAAGQLPRRGLQLFVGLWLFGTAMAMFIRARLGLDPWDVLHAGIQRHWGVSFGTVVIATSAAVLLLWIPLRQWPGVGTLANAVVIGLATDVMLQLIPAAHTAPMQWSLLLGGIVLNGFAGALYIGAQLGPGPRDGLMTGLAHRAGISLRVAKTGTEIAALSAGWLLGGQVGIGTVLYAFLIGPTVQAFLPLVTVRIDAPRPVSPAGASAQQRPLDSAPTDADLVGD